MSITAPVWEAERPSRAFCSTSSTVRPSSLSCLIVSKTACRALASSPIVGSSSRISFGSSMSARAISISFCCPPERWPARSERRSWMIGKRWAISSARRRTSVRSRSGCPPISRLSQTVISGKRLRSCATWTIPWERSAADDRRAISVSPSRIDPARGFSSPLSTLSTVDLPAPFGPITHVISPSAISRSTPRRTSAWP